MSKNDSVPIASPNGPRNKITRPLSAAVTCLSCRFFRSPPWVSEEDRAKHLQEVAFYARCARWRETRDASLLLVVGAALERDEMVRCADARTVPEMCGPTGNTWEEET